MRRPFYGSGMTNRPPPTLAKWPFVLADLLIVALLAWVVRPMLPPTSTMGYVTIIFVVIAWMGGAYVCIWPWLEEFKAQTRQLENETLASAMEQLQRLEEVGARVQTASASWQSVQDASNRVVMSAREIEEKIKAD